MIRRKETVNMTAKSFTDIAALDLAEQRRLLHNGAPEEQVWAAWALGLQLREQSKPDLLAALDQADQAGVRQHVVIILAGLGERSLLENLAEQEVDDAVRATASQYLLQTGSTTDQQRMRPFVKALLHDPSSKVRRALLIAFLERREGLIFDDLALLVTDDDDEVRELAIEALLGSVDLDRLFPGILEDRLTIEPSLPIRQRLMQLTIEAGRALHLLKLAREAPLARKQELLKGLVDRRCVFGWTELAALADQESSSADYYLPFLLDDQATLDARSWLLACCVRALGALYPPHRSDLERYDFGTRCYILLDRALQQTTASDLSASDWQAIEAIGNNLEAFDKMLGNALVQYQKAGGQIDWSQYDHIQRRRLVLEKIQALVKERNGE
jgi:HEAT repeat protein